MSLLPTSHRLLIDFNRVLMRSWHRVTPLNAPTLPRSGPVIVAPNHTSGLDPLIVQCLIRRPIVWMMAAEYLKLPCSGWFFRAVRVIPVARNGRDSAATRAALRTLAAGEVLGVFPEGRIEPTRELLPLLPGVAVLAERAGAPILPVLLEGSQRRASMLSAFVTPQDATVAFGPLLSPDADGPPHNLLDRLQKSFYQLKKSALRSGPAEEKC